ncbi:GNAT family N-acetyltransferase, partial [Nocardioides sp. CER28]
MQSIAYRTDLALLELGGSVVEDRGDRLVVRTPHNPTFHWGNFLLLDRPPAAADVPVLLADVDATFPDSTHRAIGVDGPTSDPDALAPLVAAGLSLDVAAVMTARATQAPPRPNADAT